MFVSAANGHTSTPTNQPCLQQVGHTCLQDLPGFVTVAEPLQQNIQQRGALQSLLLSIIEKHSTNGDTSTYNK
jgi:hypothetical protein